LILINLSIFLVRVDLAQVEGRRSRYLERETKECAMTYRKILSPIFGADHDLAALHAAIGLGKQFGAHVEALFPRPSPVSLLPYTYGDPSGFAAQYAIEAAIKAADEAQKRARATFDRLIDKHHIPVVTKPSAKAEATASFVVAEGDFGEVIEGRSRMSDLVVFGTKTGNAPLEGFEAALLSGARPVLFVPRDQTESVGRRVAIAYDGSAAAAHAVTAALPFLANATEIHAFEVTAEKSIALSELRDYLTLRGLTVTPHSIDPGAKGTADALLDAVEAQKCDLLVMGGYGHSRLSEFVFGGVTRHLLKHKAPLAILMAH
jgi:nucleotide-binding universal stress UspA family protein